ncbi:MAG TPA: glycosyltransferase family 39 protein [Stellaceae bacterium]|nr:glycosyltransferase family 39 protein [Stellaceae bacterium]
MLRPDKLTIERWLAGWRPFALLGVLCLCLYLPGIAAIPALDRDESRFAQATRQMLETGDFLDIRFQNEARNRKPAGIYWLQAASVSAFSSAAATAIWPYRVPSVIGATLAVLLSFVLGRELLRGIPGNPSRTALIGAVFLAIALGVMAEAHIAKTDAALLAATVAGQGALGLAYTRSRKGAPVGAGIAALFWLAETVAIFLKGPVGPLLALATAASLWVADREARWLRELRPVAGIVAVAIAVAPWLIAIESATQGQFLAESLGHDLLSKLLGGQESHGAPPFYYLALSLIEFWPGSLYLARGLIRGWQRHEEPAMRFLLAWIVPAWVFFELVPTKLPHYVLPLYPALALLAASAVAEGKRADQPAWARRTDTVVRWLWVVVTLTIAGALIVLPSRFGSGVAIAGVVGAAAMVVLMVPLAVRSPGPTAAVGMLAALALAFVVPAGSCIVPGLDQLWLSREAAALVARHSLPGGKPLVVIGYNEPSLVFLLGGKLQVIPGGGALTLPDGGEALVSGREDAIFQQGLRARGLTARAIDSVRGTDYSNGQRMVLTLYQVAPK